MELNFLDTRYLEKALSLAKTPPVSVHTEAEAFFLLLRGASEGQLRNYCGFLQKAFPEETAASCYAMTQAADIPDADRARCMIDAAYQCLGAGLPLGDETIMDGTINTSDFLGHSLWEARLMAKLAALCGLDAGFAWRLGLLHDYGRKELHTLAHTTRGFERLTDLGWDAEALGCLTHSFLGGGRCASNERAEPGFYVDESGVPRWEPDAPRDHVTLFLEAYTYTGYDSLLNIADLMATSHAIVSPAERIADIATRRELDPVNRGYFLAELVNALRTLGARIAGTANTFPALRAARGIPLEEIQAEFEAASAEFWGIYSGARS